MFARITFPRIKVWRGAGVLTSIVIWVMRIQQPQGLVVVSFSRLRAQAGGAEASWARVLPTAVDGRRNAACPASRFWLGQHLDRPVGTNRHSLDGQLALAQGADSDPPHPKDLAAIVVHPVDQTAAEPEHRGIRRIADLLPAPTRTRNTHHQVADLRSPLR